MPLTLPTKKSAELNRINSALAFLCRGDQISSSLSDQLSLLQPCLLLQLSGVSLLESTPISIFDALIMGDSVKRFTSVLCGAIYFFFISYVFTDDTCLLTGNELLAVLDVETTLHCLHDTATAEVVERSIGSFRSHSIFNTCHFAEVDHHG